MAALSYFAIIASPIARRVDDSQDRLHESVRHNAEPCECYRSNERIDASAPVPLQDDECCSQDDYAANDGHYERRAQ